MSKALRVVYWVGAILLVLFLVGLGLKLAKAFIGVALVVGVAVLLYAFFGPSKAKKS